MIDLVGLPVPDDAPPEGSCVRVERPEEGLVRIVLDPPHRPKLAVFDVPLLHDFDHAVDQLLEDKSLRGLVITGRSPLSFVAGADVETIAGVEDPALSQRFAREGQALFQRIHRLGKRGGGRVTTVAAVGGPVPGGACELALACDRIVLVDHEKTRIGLPEVLLGIFPAWGGTQRAPRRMGVVAALQAILTGRLMPARKAYKSGLVDRLTKSEYLLRIADGIAMGRDRCAWRGRRGLGRLLVDKNPLAGAWIARTARKDVLKRTHGHYPAPLAVIPLVVNAPRTPIDAGLRAEAKVVEVIDATPVAKNLLQIFLLSERAKRAADLPDGSRAPRIGRAAVVGAGVMGGAIAGLMAEKGVSVRLRDLDQKQLDAAEREHRAAVKKKLKQKRMARHAADAAVDRLEVTMEGVGFGRCELVVEAVAERLEVKRAVLGELAAAMPADAILATNTSSLSVGAIAETLPGPERVVGMHFFNPVRKMPLVEVVRGARTSDEVVARVARLAMDMGKTPVVTADVPGFLVNRVLGPYLDEALRLVAEGVPPERLDAALVGFGMPMGPCALLDEVGLDIASHAGASLEAAYGERMRACDFLAPLIEAGNLGKKTGSGIYVWKKGKKPRPSSRLPRRPRAPEMSEETLVDRLVLVMVNEAARCLAEEVVAGPGELDLATVFGTGFAPFRGGVLRYADARGLPAIVERLNAFHDAPEIAGGERRPRFEPAPLLTELAQGGARFHG